MFLTLAMWNWFLLYVTFNSKGTKHANRNPGDFLEGDPNYPENWGFEGDFELNTIGKRQAHGIGKMLRDRYGGLISDYYYPSETKAYSSSANRCQMTVQLGLLGLYPPRDWQRWNETSPGTVWTPVPVDIDDPLLRMYKMSECRASTEGWAPIDDDSLPDLAQWLTDEAEVIEYVANNTGWDKSISDMADVADNILNIDRLGYGEWAYPDWLASPSLANYTNETLRAKIMEFGEAHQIACAEYAPCRNIMGGYWLNDLIMRLQKKNAGKSEKLKLVVYGSHTEITMSAMKLMGINVHEVPTGAGFILEYRTKPYPSIRLLYHEPREQLNDTDLGYSTVELAEYSENCTKGGNVTDWCPLQTWIKRVKVNATDNWKEACGIEDGCTDLSSALNDDEKSAFTKHCQRGLPEWPSPSHNSLGTYTKAAVAADNSLCSEIGRDILVKGGNAVDAAIATLLCLGVVNPQNSGLGGGHFFTFYNRTAEECYTIDARERAPNSAYETMYTEDDDETAQSIGWKSIAVPGEVHGLWREHTKFGSLNWKTLVQPSVDLAKNGFPVSESLGLALSIEREKILNESTMSVFVNSETGDVYKTGEILKRPLLATTLSGLAKSKNASKSFYRGKIAKKNANEFNDNGGYVTKKDLYGYSSIEREPLYTKSVNGLKMCGPPPPSSSAIVQAVINVMAREGITPETHLSSVDDQVSTYHRYVETLKYAYANRFSFGDSSFVPKALEIAQNMTSTEWALSTKAKLESQTKEQTDYGASFTSKTSGTTSVTVIDSDGNAVSVTSSVNTDFGSLRRSESTGIVWNNHMDDFSSPGVSNSWGLAASEANYIKQKKRPQSSISPIVLFNSTTGDVIMAIGAAGGSKIISAVAYVSMRALFFNETLKEAVDSRRLYNQLTPYITDYEVGFPEVYVERLKALGHNMSEVVSDKLAGCITAVKPSGCNATAIFANSDFRRGYWSMPAGY